MTETNTTIFPPGRYGHRRQGRKSRSLPVILAGVVALGTLGIAYKLHRQYGPEEYEATLSAYRDVTDSQVVVEFIVTKPAGQPAKCVLRARDRSGAVVGRATVPVTSPGKRVEVTYTLATSTTPVGAETIGCLPGH